MIPVAAAGVSALQSPNRINIKRTEHIQIQPSSSESKCNFKEHVGFDSSAWVHGRLHLWACQCRCVRRRCRFSFQRLHVYPIAAKIESPSVVERKVMQHNACKITVGRLPNSVCDEHCASTPTHRIIQILHATCRLPCTLRQSRLHSPARGK